MRCSLNTMAAIPASGLKLLAERTGLSVSTVSRVLNGKGEASRISEATRERVLQEAAHQGIIINEVARGLRLRSTHTLGLIIPDISNPFFASLARQVEHASRARGYTVLLCDSQESAEVEAENIRMMLSRRVDGLVIAPVGGKDEHLRNLPLPVVMLDRVPAGINAPSISADNAAGGKLAVKYLLDAGHRHIACVQGAPESPTNQARISGICKAMKSAGMDMPAERITGYDYTLDSAKAAANELLTTQRDITAVIALGNVMALGVLHAARDLGIIVPEQLSLVAFDDQPWAEWISPPLTTVTQPVEKMGAKAMDLFFQQLQAEPHAVSKSITLPMKLVKRQSVISL